MQRRRLVRAVLVRPDLVGGGVLTALRRAVDSPPCRGKGGPGCDGISSNGRGGREGFQWARIQAPRSAAKFSDDHVQKWTLFSHSRFGRGGAEILTSGLSYRFITQKEAGVSEQMLEERGKPAHPCRKWHTTKLSPLGSARYFRPSRASQRRRCSAASAS